MWFHVHIFVFLVKINVRSSEIGTHVLFFRPGEISYSAVLKHSRTIRLMPRMSEVVKKLAKKEDAKSFLLCYPKVLLPTEATLVPVTMSSNQQQIIYYLLIKRNKGLKYNYINK